MKSLLFILFLLPTTIFTNPLWSFFQPFFEPSTKTLPHEPTQNSIHEFVVQNFVQLVKNHGYPAEEHKITTEDGYILTFHRIPSSPKSSRRKFSREVVFLQHGIFSSSDGWVLTQPSQTLAFLLADHGYDVWMGNARGNTYSQTHKNLTTDDESFWKFSFHEIAMYDLPAMIDYILRITGVKAINYIGHSMGTTVSFVLLSSRPEYNDKIKFAISLAPVALWKVPPTTILPITNSTYNIFKMFLKTTKILEIFPQTTSTAKLIHDYCGPGDLMQPVCDSFIKALIGDQPSQINPSLIPYVLSHVPAGGSSQTLLHFGQNILHGAFQQYDYAEDNEKIYRTTNPPLYNLTKITTPFLLMFTEDDDLVRPENVRELGKSLANLVGIIDIPDPQFNHVAYFWARNAKSTFHDTIINFLDIYNNPTNRA